MIVGPLIGGPLLDRKGPKLTLGLAIIVFAITVACMYQLDATETWDAGRKWWIIGSCCAGTGMGLYSSTVSATTSKWNPDNVGWAIGIDNIGPALGPFWAAPVAGMAAPVLGIGNGFALIFGIAICGLFFFGFLPFRTPNPDWTPKDPAKKGKAEQKSLAQEANERALPLSQVFRDPKLYILICMGFFHCVAFMMFTMNLSTIYIEGQSAYMDQAAVVAMASVVISVGSIMNTIARPFSGTLLDKLRSPWKTVSIIYTGFIIMLVFMLVVYRQPGLLIAIATVCIYFFGGSAAPVHMSSLPTLFGTKNSGTLIMMILVSTGVAWIIAPVIGSSIFDATGTYAGALAVMIVSECIALGIALIMRAREKKEAKQKQ